MAKKIIQPTQTEQMEIVRTELEIQAEKAAKHREYHNSQHKHHHTYITNRIRVERYNETLDQTRQSLSNKYRTLSKVIHKPIIDNLGEFISITLARPTSIIIAALVSLIAGLITLWVGHSVGFEVPNTLFIILFFVGYIIGLIIELIIYIAKKIKH